MKNKYRTKTNKYTRDNIISRLHFYKGRLHADDESGLREINLQLIIKTLRRSSRGASHHKIIAGRLKDLIHQGLVLKVVSFIQVFI